MLKTNNRSMEIDSMEEVTKIKNYITELNAMLQTKENLSRENLITLRTMLLGTVHSLDYLDEDEEEMMKIKNDIRREIKDEIKIELKQKSSLNLCVEDDVTEFINKYCEFGADKSIQSSKLTKYFNEITNNNVTVRRIGIIMKCICDKYPIKKQLKTGGTFYNGLDIKTEYSSTLGC